MRAAAAAFALVAAFAFVAAFALSARADVSLDARRRPPSPHTPLGPACDRALADAQAALDWRAGYVHFHTRERHVAGDYEWSDMCGVWGNYSLELAPDRRPPRPWRWSERVDRDKGEAHRRGVLRAHGMRATFILDADDPSDLGDWFVDAFRPAVEACLATASAPR